MVSFKSRVPDNHIFSPHEVRVECGDPDYVCRHLKESCDWGSPQQDSAVCEAAYSYWNGKSGINTDPWDFKATTHMDYQANTAAIAGPLFNPGSGSCSDATDGVVG